MTNSNHEIPNILEPGTWMDNFESDYFPIVYKILNVFKEQLFKLSLTFLNSVVFQNIESEIVIVFYNSIEITKSRRKSF